jgi:hypothetical protein
MSSNRSLRILLLEFLIKIVTTEKIADGRRVLIAAKNPKDVQGRSHLIRKYRLGINDLIKF